MAKVFVVVDSGHNYKLAEPRGQLVYLFKDKVNVFASDKLTKEVEQKLAKAAEGDFLLPSGNALVNCLAFTVLMNMFGKVNILIYSFKNETYEVRTIQKGQFVTAQGGA